MSQYFMEPDASLLCSQSDITESEVFMFLGSIIKMVGDTVKNLKYYWSITEQLISPFYGKIMISQSIYFKFKQIQIQVEI
jgi:hypothetical protein